MFTETATQGIGIQDVLNSQSINGATAYSVKNVDMSTCKRAYYIIQGGTNGGGWTAYLVACATANIAAANTNITGATTGSITGNTQVATLEVRSDQVTNLGSTFRYVRLAINTTGATTLGAVGLAVDGVQRPVSQSNLNATFIGAQNICNI